jgi:hypothetical protein
MPLFPAWINCMVETIPLVTKRHPEAAKAPSILMRISTKKLPQAILEWKISRLV